MIIDKINNKLSLVKYVYEKKRHTDNNFSLCRDVNWIFDSIFTPVRKLVNL